MTSATAACRGRALVRAAVVVCALAVATALAQSRAPASAPLARTLHVAFPVSETGFDPQATSDLYSDHVQRAIFETLYGFDYPFGPAEVVEFFRQYYGPATRAFSTRSQSRSPRKWSRRGT